jgi:low molecular weight protein-tyrosine phosphatase
VCTGNICRSPFMERALQFELDRTWGPGRVLVASAGTGALAGYAMEDQARVVLEAAGYSAHGFLARDLAAALIEEADLVLTATRRHRARVATLHPRALRYVFTFREFADLVSGLVPASGAGENAQGDAGAHIRHVVQLAAAQRGVRPPLSDAEADIVDPYRQDAAVFDRMTEQIMGALPVISRALGPA